MIIPANPSASKPAALAAVVPLPSRAPERLVGVGFRCWLKGLSTGDIGCWEEAFNAFSAPLGPERARDLLIELSQFVRAVSATAERSIEVSETGACGFCRDECLAISIIAACQHDARSALQASASALIGSADIGDTISGAQTFATGMAFAKQYLSLDSVCPATCALRTQGRRPV
jgi:hypothetical protein